MHKRPAWLAAVVLLCALNCDVVSGQQRGLSPETDNQKNAPLAVQGDYFALVIGNNDYPNLPPLHTAVGDAESIAQILTDRYGFHVKLLLNASRDQIVGALNEYRRELDAHSNFLIYYAGHGQFDQAVNKYYWLPIDAQPHDNTKWIIADDVTSDIRGTPASHILVVSDSCYSGTMRGADVSFDPHDRERLLGKMMAGHSRDLLSSGGNEPVSDTGSAGHSVFAAAFLRGIETEPDPVFSGDELFERYIKLQVGGNARQTPQYGPLGDSGHSFGDFVFVRKGTKFAYDPSTAPPALARSSSESSGAEMGGASPAMTAAVSPSAVKAALLALDVDSLTHMTAAGVRPAVVEDAFRQFAGDAKTTIAQQFFENTTDSADALAWLDAALAAGMDPNMVVPSTTFGHEGILAVAMRAGNAKAAKILLRRGASPHAYEDLFLTRYTAPRFLFPLESIVDDAHFSIDEKRDLTRAFLDAGAVVPEVAPPAEMTGSEMFEATQQQKDFATKLGIKLTPSESCCKQPGPICKSASSHTATDWCAIVAALPRALTYASAPGTSSPFYNLSLPYLLAIANNNAYFLGRIEYPNKMFSPDYVLVGVTRDATTWSVYKFMAPEAEMGLCKKDADDSSDSPRPEWCWRKTTLYRVADTDQMHSDLFDNTWKIARNP
ncbi:MAG TPA: caspase family protein [Terracidiphilus sp.]|nr:caspase family protein [Terracidiphilus sp.]